MDKLALKFYRMLLALACTALLLAFVCVLLGVVSRLLRFSVPGLDAYAGYAIAAALFLALPATLRHGDHIRVTLLLDRVPPALRGALQWWSLLAGLALSGYMAWFSVRLVWVSWITDDRSTAADAAALWVPQLALAVGSVGFAIAFVHAILRQIGGGHLIATAEPALAE